MAAALVHGRLGISELTLSALKNPLVLKLAERLEMIEDDSFNQHFPEKRLAQAVIKTNDGSLYDSGKVEPIWEASSPPADLELREKFRRLSCEQLPAQRAIELESNIWRCEELCDLSELLSLVTMPLTRK